MGFVELGAGWGVGCLTRRKQVDSIRSKPEGAQQLAKELSVVQLIAIGNLHFLCFFFSNFFFVLLKSNKKSLILSSILRSLNAIDDLQL